jgi:hypothetical protein
MHYLTPTRWFFPKGDGEAVRAGKASPVRRTSAAKPESVLVGDKIFVITVLALLAAFGAIGLQLGLG